jgi:hypothetical protein
MSKPAAWPSQCLSLTRLLLLLDDVGSVENNYDINNPGHDHVAAAISFDENGDMQAAVQSFRAAAKYQPTNPVNWRNLAISLQEIDGNESEKMERRAEDALDEQINRARDIGVDVKLRDELRQVV